MAPHKHKLVWGLTIPIFVFIVAVWAWHVQYLFRNLPADSDLKRIVDTMSADAKNTFGGYAAVSKQIDAQTKALNAVFTAQSVKASAIEQLKAKVEAAAGAKAPTGSLAPAPNTNVNTPKQ
jgi:hypothetical protein